MKAELDFIHEFVPGSSKRTLLLLHGTGGNEHDLIPLDYAPGHVNALRIETVAHGMEAEVKHEECKRRGESGCERFQHVILHQRRAWALNSGDIVGRGLWNH